MLYYPDILKELRKDKGLKQEDMAEYFGIVQSTYSDFENGKRKMPLTMLDSLADLLGTSTDYILGRTAEMKPYPKRPGRKEAVIRKNKDEEGEKTTGAVDYSPLWETIKARQITKQQLIKAGIDRKTMDSLNKGKNITMLTLEKLCKIIGCTPDDIVRFK